MLQKYRVEEKRRAADGLPPEPLTAEEVEKITALLNSTTDIEQIDELLYLLENRVPPGVDAAAKVKAEYLASIVEEEGVSSAPLTKVAAVKMLATMRGGYNIAPLIAALDSDELEVVAATVVALSHTTLIYDAINSVNDKRKKGSESAAEVMESWASAEWFKKRAALPEKITLTVFKVPGETNTDDLSPGMDAWSRPDIPLHALSMLKMKRAGLDGDPLEKIAELKQKGFPIVYVGDVVGTGSSRKSATNSLLWHTGNDIEYVPNKRDGGYCFGGQIAPIFFNTLEDAGTLPLEMSVSSLNMGDTVDLYPLQGELRDHKSSKLITTFKLKTEIILAEVQAGGRIPLMIGRALTEQSRKLLGRTDPSPFTEFDIHSTEDSETTYTLAQKLVGRACGRSGVAAGEYCEPRVSSVGSQDTTGPMTRDELKDLACLDFSADLVLQSFCHTAAYPRPVDITTQKTLPNFMQERRGISLKPGDGIIHSWLNRMLLPDTVGTGGDSHTRFPLGISFPAGSGLVAFAAATGIMPLDMPESVLVRFSGDLQPGITLRDLVHAIPYFAIKQGALTVEKKGKKNIFSGRILEIEGLEDLPVEQAFELTDASAERSASAATINLSEKSVAAYLRSNIALLKTMIEDGYESRKTLERRIAAMEQWLAASEKSPQLLRADQNATYAAVIEIDMNSIVEPILCAPNDPDDAKKLSEVAGVKVDEVFIGSCMTNIGHFRAAGKLLEDVSALSTRLWIAPPTRMDREQLMEEGVYNVFGRSGARLETPGCSLCMGNQARIADNSTALSTSTRNFPNRLGNSSDVYLASAELSTIAAVMGKIPTVEEYHQQLKLLSNSHSEIYKSMDFSKKDLV